LVFQF